MSRSVEWGVGLVMSLGLFATPAGAGVKTLSAIPQLGAYAQAQTRVEVEPGRRIHLYCQGRGAPTVVLTAGLGAWSATWGLVQPGVAKTTRVCAWDRAGFGHSDGSPAPQDSAATTSDLERALVGGGERGPFVLVGNSAGVYEVLAFTDRRPGDVAGIVLVDPARPHDMKLEAAVSPQAAALDRAYYAGEAERLRTCASGVEAGTVATGKPTAPCFQYYPEYPPAVRQAMAVRDADPKRLRSQASSFEQYELNGERAVKPHRDYGQTPIIVLTAALGLPWPDEVKADIDRLNADWADSHVPLAALSRRGERRIVPGSGHLIQLERPNVVEAAIIEIVATVRQARPKS